MTAPATVAIERDKLTGKKVLRLVCIALDASQHDRDWINERFVDGLYATRGDYNKPMLYDDNRQARRAVAWILDVI